MAYRNPWKARLAQWRKQWPRPLQEIEAQAFAVLQIAYEGVTVEDAEQRRKNILCYFQGLTSFAKLREGAEVAALASRLEALEVLEAARQAEDATNGYHAGQH